MPMSKALNSILVGIPESSLENNTRSYLNTNGVDVGFVGGTVGENLLQLSSNRIGQCPEWWYHCVSN